MIIKDFEGLLENMEGEFSVILKDLNQDKVLFSFNGDRTVKSASTIKIPIMMEIMAQVKEKKLSLEQEVVIEEKDKVPFSTITKMKTNKLKLYDLLLFMMSTSDNTATNVLIDIGGMEHINGRMKTLGVEKTALRRKMMDFDAAAKGFENYICGDDLAILLEMLYKGTYLDDRELCNQMLEFMSTGANLEHMDRYLPEDLKVAHKTGGLDHVDHDCGLVFLKQYVEKFMNGTEAFEKMKAGELGDYMLIILSTGAENNVKGRENISKISEWVYHRALKGWA